MSSPYRPAGAGDEPTVSFGGGPSDETQVVRPPEGGYGADSPSPDLRKQDRDDRDHDGPTVGAPAPADTTAADDRPDPFSAPMPAVAPEPGRYSDDRPGSWSSAEPDDSRSGGPAVTSVYPQSTPEYAPAGYPAAYAPATVVPPPASSVVPEKPSSRVGPASSAL